MLCLAAGKHGMRTDNHSQGMAWGLQEHFPLPPRERRFERSRHDRQFLW